jgi:hypothetical protein
MKVRDLLLAGMFYVAATIVLTYPLAFHPSSLSRLDNGDAQLNAWAVSWVGHQILNNPRELFQANTFYPLPNSLAFSEHLFVPGLIALPILLASDDLVFTYNMLLLISIFLSAAGMYLLVASLTGNRTAALLSGLFFSFASYRFVRLPHIQMQLYGFIPLALAGLHRFFETGKPRWAFAFSAFFLLQALSGTYLAAMTAVASAIALVTLGIGSKRNSRQLIILALAIGMAVLVLYPFVRPYLWVNRTLGIEWGIEGIGSMSATWVSYLASASRLYRGMVGTILSPGDVKDFLFPGVTVALLGAVGMGLLVANLGKFKRPRATAACYLGVFVCGLALSFGPASPFYTLLYEKVVFFRGLRALTRFGLLPLLSLSVLSGFALAWLFDRLKSSRARFALALGIGGLFVGESLVAPLALTRFDDEPPQAYQWLKTEGEPGPMVELPFKRFDTRYMFRARHHGFRRTLNGDSGFIPVSHGWMREIFLRFPSPDAIDLLRTLEVRYVVIHWGAYLNTPRRLARVREGLKDYATSMPEVQSLEDELILEVLPAETDLTHAPAGRRIDATGPSALLDSNLNTHWQAESRDAVVELRLEQSQPVTGIRFQYGPAPRVPVVGVEVESMDENGNWRPVFASSPDWPALSNLVMSLLENPGDGTQTLSFEVAVRTDALRLKLRGYGKPAEIAEIAVLGISSR